LTKLAKHVTISHKLLANLIINLTVVLGILVLVMKQDSTTNNLIDCIKPRNKRSKNNYLYSESRRLVRMRLQGYSEWTCEGSLKLKESRRLRGSCPLSEGCI
jgi:hypothetical protein